MNEYDMVILKEDAKSFQFLKGMKGTILLVYKSENLAYEVEFINSAGESVGTYTVSHTDLELAGQR